MESALLRWRLGTSDTHILFSKTDAQSGDREYTLVVSPQGWQPAHIEVQTEEHVTFSAGGKICIDVSDILEKVEARLSLEKKIIAEQHIRVDDPSESRTPEDFFTEEQARSLKLVRPWVGPEGFSLDKFKPWFTVNDVQYKTTDPELRNIFYNDNFGQFWVTVKITNK